jgi:very-short-patch-repair endonuclease
VEQPAHAQHRGYKFRRQHPIGPYIADFAHVRGRLVIEVDGTTHWSAGDIARDKRRDAYLASQGWMVVRFPNDDVYRDVSRVVEEIARRLPLT